MPTTVNPSPNLTYETPPPTSSLPQQILFHQTKETYPVISMPNSRVSSKSSTYKTYPVTPVPNSRVLYEINPTSTKETHTAPPGPMVVYVNISLNKENPLPASLCPGGHVPKEILLLVMMPTSHRARPSCSRPRITRTVFFPASPCVSREVCSGVFGLCYFIGLDRFAADLAWGILPYVFGWGAGESLTRLRCGDIDGSPSSLSSVGGSVFRLGLEGVPQALGPALEPPDQLYNSLVAMKLQVGVCDYPAEPEEVFWGDNVSCALALAPCSVRFLVGPPRGGPQGYYLTEVLPCYSPQVFVRGPWFAFVPDVGLVDLFFPEVSDVFLDPVFS